jgi:hypothetical protein
MDQATYRKGMFVGKPEYIFSWIVRYIDTYANLPRIDMQKCAQQIVDRHGITFEDRTELLEQIQVNRIAHGVECAKIFIKAGQDATEANGKLMILFRRTLLSNAAMIYYKCSMSHHTTSNYPWDFKIFFRDDFIKSERGHLLTEETYTNLIRGLIRIDECSICISPIEGNLDKNGQLDNVFIDCGHAFHTKCFQGWMNSTTDYPIPCPNCRVPYTPTAKMRANFPPLLVSSAIAQDLVDVLTHGNS